MFIYKFNFKNDKKNTKYLQHIKRGGAHKLFVPLIVINTPEGGLRFGI